jgi:hypothetical protein
MAVARTKACRLAHNTAHIQNPRRGNQGNERDWAHTSLSWISARRRVSALASRLATSKLRMTAVSMVSRYRVPGRRVR